MVMEMVRGLGGECVIFYNQIKINKNSYDCKLVAENGRQIEIAIDSLLILGRRHTYM